MTTLDPSTSTPHVDALRLASVLYATTLFLSALLLFLLQPMFTKMVLPRLGGSPTVWSVAMVFFQAALLTGYTYAHVLVRWLSRRGRACSPRRSRSGCSDLADRHCAEFRDAAHR